MKIKFICASVLLFALIIVSCNNSDQKSGEDDQLESEVTEVARSKDSTVIEAYGNDKSVITINDIDPKDASYSTRTKTLYESVNGGTKLAVVYGYKSDDSPGIAIVQRNAEAPVKLPQTKSTGVNQAEYSNGAATLIRDGETVSFSDDSDSGQFAEIK